nr:acylphosphatase [Dermatophilus congolensis]
MVSVEKATFFVSGHVQGVGFRWWTKSQALELGLDGFARNLCDGRVEVVAQGNREAIEELGARLATQPSQHRRPGRAEAVVTQWGSVRQDVGRFREL